MKRNIFFLDTGKLAEDPTNETTGGTTPDSDGKFVQLEKDDATSSNASPSAGDEPIFPSGTQTYKVTSDILISTSIPNK
jgi:hypothetical protein